jgi:hypothetical protein
MSGSRSDAIGAEEACQATCGARTRFRSPSRHHARTRHTLSEGAVRFPVVAFQVRHPRTPSPRNVSVVAKDHVGVILAAGRPAPHLMVGHGDALAIRDVEDTANSSCGGSAPSGKSLAACLLAALASLAVVAGGAECSGRAARSRARAEALRARRGIGRIPERLAQIQGRAEVMGPSSARSSRPAASCSIQSRRLRHGCRRGRAPAPRAAPLRWSTTAWCPRCS